MGLNKELRAILRESARGTFRESSGYPVLEANDCHSPAGSPGGGQFCSKGGQPATGDRARISQDWRNAMGAAGLRTDRPGRVKVEHLGSGQGSSPQHVANYRGMEIHTLPGYMTPYYFVHAPGFGGMYHSPSLARIKKQVDTFKDTGLTAHRADRAKASARYQKRKARYGRG